MKRWFENIGFRKNPFSLNPFANNIELIGRQEELDEIVYRIRSSGMLFIEGKEGYGKTTLLRNAINSFRDRIIYVNCNNIQKQLNIESLLINKHGFVKGRLLRNMPVHMILMLDNVSQLTKTNCERIKYFFDNDHLSSVVFTGESLDNSNFSNSLRERIGKRIIKLNPLSYEQIADMVESRLGEKYVIDRSLIKKLYDFSENNPKQLLMNLTRLLKHAIENKEDILKLDFERILSEKKEETEDFGLEEKRKDTELCVKCKTRLTRIGDYWRCENCDTCCSVCGTFVRDENEQFCPGCGAEFVRE